VNGSRVALCATVLSLVASAGVLAAPPAHAANHAPYVPRNLRIVWPRAAACPAASTPLLINAAPQFEARLTDTDGPTASIAARWEAFRTDTGARVWTGVTGFVDNGATVRLRMDPTKVAHGLTYRFRARAEDGSLASAWSGSCYFKIDLRAPGSIKIESSDYPEYDPGGSEVLWLSGINGWDRAFGKPGQAGAFRITSADAVEYHYWVTGDPRAQVVRATGPKREATVTVAPRSHGLNRFSVRGVDAAGNLSRTPVERIFRVGGAPGPVGEWRFDETTGTVAVASVGTKNLALQGTREWDKPGRLDGALRLDSTAKARTGAVVDTAKSFSVSAWVRLDRPTDNGRVVSQLNASGHGFALSWADNRWTFGRNSSTGGRAVQSIGTHAPRYWTHVVGVYDAATGQQKLYVDSDLAGQTSGAPGGGASGELVVGGSVAAGVDHLQIWPRALGPDEINPLYDLRDADQEPHAGLLARWQFEGGAAAGGADSSGNDQPLSFGPDVAWGDDPLRGGYLRLNATGGNGFAQTSGPLFDGTKSFTIMAWVRPADRASGTIVGQGGTPPAGQPQTPNIEVGLREISSIRSSWTFDRSGTGGDDLTTKLTEWGKWELVAATYDRARDEMSIYVGGGLPRATVDPLSVWHSDRPLVLGKILAGSTLRKVFVGDIDDVRIYRGVLSHAQIQQIREATG
jgi:hypothetical protein